MFLASLKLTQFHTVVTRLKKNIVDKIVVNFQQNNVKITGAVPLSAFAEISMIIVLSCS